MHTGNRGLITRKGVLAVTAAGLAATLVACSSSSSKSSPPTTATSGTAKVESSSTTAAATSAGYDPNGIVKFAFDLSQAGGIQFDPAMVTVYDSAVVIGQLLYDSLLRQQPDGSLVPALATAATVVDPQTISVTLRSGVTFQDGTPLNAAAVKFTILRNRDAKSTAFPAPINDVASVDVNSDTSLTIHLTKAEAGAFFPLLAGLATMPVSPAAVQKNDQNPVTNPLGAGPFHVKEFVPEQHLLMVKSPTYWDAKDIKLGGVEYVQEQVGTPASINALKAGAVDIVGSDISQLGALSGGGIQTSIASSPTSLLWFQLCKTHKPLDDLRVRQALNYGLDKNAINQALAGGKGEPTWALVSKSSNLFPTDLDNYYAYDPAKAKALLAQAGYANGLTLTNIPSPGINIQLSEIAQQEWKQIGVNVEIKPTANVVQDVYSKHLADMSASSVIRSGYDALNSIYTPGHLGDLCGYQDPSLTAMINQLAALPSTDPQYVQIWHQAQDFIVHNALSVWGIWLPTVIGYNGNRVGGVQTIFLGVTAYPDFLTAYVKK